MLYFLDFPLRLSPLLERDLVETARARGIDLILDVRRGDSFSLLERRLLQDVPNLTYEHISVEQRESRSLPYVSTHRVKSLLKNWPAGLPARVLILHGGEDRWWVRFLAEHCLIEIEKLRLEWIGKGAGPGR